MPRSEGIEVVLAYHPGRQRAFGGRGGNLGAVLGCIIGQVLGQGTSGPPPTVPRAQPRSSSPRSSSSGGGLEISLVHWPARAKEQVVAELPANPQEAAG
jgi:hypothetical protein